MRYRVPQNIDMEDRIIGPLTMAQFVYVSFGGMVIYLLYLNLGETQPALFAVIAIPLLLLTLAFAFLKIQDQPFPKFLAALLLYLVKPKARIWIKDQALADARVIHKTPSRPEERSPQHQLVDPEELRDLSGVLDTGGRGAGVEVRAAGATTTHNSQLTTHPVSPVSAVDPSWQTTQSSGPRQT